MYPSSRLRLSAYLVLIVVFGTVGHCGVEPLPPSWARVPVLGLVTGGAFHAAQLRDETGNFWVLLRDVGSADWVAGATTLTGRARSGLECLTTVAPDWQLARPSFVGLRGR